MTIKKNIDNTKEAESDISEIKVAIKNKTDIPEQFMEFEIIETSRICASSDEKNGANILLIEM